MQAKPGGPGGQPRKGKDINVGLPIVIVAILIVLGIVVFFYSRYGQSKAQQSGVDTIRITDYRKSQVSPWDITKEAAPRTATPADVEAEWRKVRENRNKGIKMPGDSGQPVPAWVK
jgi:hypothetical protein